MEIKNRSVIFKPEDLNVVDMATGGGVADNYIQMASDIIFHKGLEDDQPTIHVIEPQLSGARIINLWQKDNEGPRFTP
jgi:hypothetical protein